MNRRQMMIATAAAMVPAAAFALPRAIIMTGDMGSIGSRLSEQWRGDGIYIAGIDKQHGPESDLFYPDASWSHILHIADTVVHLAASFHPDTVQRDNINGTCNLLRALPSTIKRIVYASSVQAHPARYGHKSGSDLPTDWYRTSKVLAELQLQQWARDTGGTAVAIRLGWVPHLDMDVPKIMPTFLAEWPAKVLIEESVWRRAFTDALDAEGGYSVVETVP